MRELTRKILEAGLVDKTTALMLERWGQLEEGASELVDQKAVTKKTLEEFIEEIEVLTEPSTEVKETVLELQVTKPPLEFWSHQSGGFAAVEDEMGRLVVRPLLDIHVGDPIWISKHSGSTSGQAPDMVVLEIDKLYEGDKVVALRLTTERR